MKIMLACCILHNFITIEDGVPLDVEIEEEDDYNGINMPILDTYVLTQWNRDEWGNFWDELAWRMWEDYRSQQ